MESKFLLAQSALLIICGIGTYHVTHHQVTPYMDEVFHIPQAQKYCNGSFQEWDPKITTLPGLYLFSVGIFKPLSVMANSSTLEWCSTFNLRSMNTIFAVGNFYLFYAITYTLNKARQREEGDAYAITKSVALSLMPLLFFFNFLYYTDPGSLFFILYSYYYHLHDSCAQSSVLGMVSLIFRQTNIVWVFFMAVCNLCRNIHKQQKIQKEALTIWSFLTNALPIFIINAVISCWGYAIVGITAVAFVLWNGSVVVGDKSAHEACFNPPQLLYFACFTLALSFPHFVSTQNVRKFVKSMWSNKLISLLAALCSIALVHQFTQVHEYLVADNRHYTFYVWSKLLGKYELARYLLIPAAMFVYWHVNDSLSHMHWMIRCCLWGCVGAALVPQKLMEFRYFVVPYTIVRLHMRNESIRALLLEMAFYICINIFTFYIFLYKPVFWPQIHEPQRIMW